MDNTTLYKEKHYLNHMTNITTEALLYALGGFEEETPKTIQIGGYNKTWTSRDWSIVTEIIKGFGGLRRPKGLLPFGSGLIIAERIQRPVETVRTQLYYARKKAERLGVIGLYSIYGTITA